MVQSAIAVRYAKAFFSTAKEKKLLDKLKADIQLIMEVCSTSEDFILLLESPVVKASQKTALIKSIFNGKIEGISLNFLSLIIKNRREAHIPGICRNFLDLTRKDLNIKSAVITTAIEIDTATVKKVEDMLSKQLKAKVELSTHINPDIIGGLLLRLDDKQYDASISTQLKKVKQSLLETEV